MVSQKVPVVQCPDDLVRVAMTDPRLAAAWLDAEFDPDDPEMKEIITGLFCYFSEPANPRMTTEQERKTISRLKRDQLNSVLVLVSNQKIRTKVLEVSQQFYGEVAHPVRP